MFRHRLWNFLHSVVWPVVLFFGLYFAILIGAGVLVGPEDLAALHGLALAAALVATLGANWLHDRGSWRVGFGGGALTAVRETLLGVAFASIVIGLIDILIILTTGFRHIRGGGLEWSLIATLFVPAAIHEEVLFRGYPFQKVLAWNLPVGVLGWSLLFAAAHLGNEGVTLLGTLNIFLAGVLLSLAYLLYRRLWFPVALHIWWNVLTGPVLGHEVSGLTLDRTLLETVDPGPPLLTGGSFGLEASIWATLVEVIAIVILLRQAAKSRRLGPMVTGQAGPADHDRPATGMESE